MKNKLSLLTYFIPSKILQKYLHEIKMRFKKTSIIKANRKLIFVV